MHFVSNRVYFFCVYLSCLFSCLFLFCSCLSVSILRVYSCLFLNDPVYFCSGPPVVSRFFSIPVHDVSRAPPQFKGSCDRVLLDCFFWRFNEIYISAPCHSGYAVERPKSNHNSIQISPWVTQGQAPSEKTLRLCRMEVSPALKLLPHRCFTFSV